MDEPINDVAANLANAIEAILNPLVSQSDRQNAHQICEDFKESSPFCVPVGLILAKTTYKPVVRHFGLQLLEHAIKFRWNDMKKEEKEFLKDNALKFIANGTLGILQEEFHIKDAVTRITVELAKRDWPQLWPSFQEDLYKLCQMGPTQKELVLKVYLRLAEDAVLLQTIPQQRRREIMLGLTTNMKDLLDMFIRFLKEHTDAAVQEGVKGNTEANQVHIHVSEAVLSTLPAYLDWMNMNLIFANNGVLLEMLCLLLNNNSLQLLAVECLLTIVSRKGKAEERKPLLMLFSDNAMRIILSTAVAAEKASAQEEYYYLFLKKLCLVLTELGKQVCVLWDIPDCGQPPNFAMFLDALMSFTVHPSQMISSYTQSLWLLFMKHEIISQDPVLLSFIPKIFESYTKILRKVGFPSRQDSPSCDYSRQDFDSDDCFTSFFSKYRADLADTIRHASLLQPKLAFEFAVMLLQSTLTKPIDTGMEGEMQCNLNSPSFVDWDAMALMIESIMSRVMMTDFHPDPNTGVALLKCALDFQSQDPLILSSLLSCISALVVFLKYSPDTVLVVLQKIFSVVTFALPGQTKSTRSRAVKNVRQHACSMLVTICKVYTDLIYPVFNELYSYIKNISQDTEQLSQMEKCILIEAIILVCNKSNNFEKQSSFLEEILQPVKDLWLSEEFKMAFSSSNMWISYVGLDQAPVEPSSADTCGINRSHISYCINTLLAVMKRSKWPEDIQTAQDGGFILMRRDDGSVILRNPATNHVGTLLDNLLSLVKSMNGSWHPEMLKLRHPDYAKSYDLLENEKFTILGVPQPVVDVTSNATSKHPLTRMQNFLSTTHETCCHILGNAGQCLGYEFYAVPNLAQSILQNVVTQMNYLPEYRLKPIIRVFLKPFIISCPKDLYVTSLIPVLEYLCPYFYEKLKTKWSAINQRISEGGGEDNMEAQEILDDQLTRVVSREYIDLLDTIFHKLKHQEAVPDESKMEDSENEVGPAKEEIMTDLGQICMKYESVYPAVMMCVFGALSWSDTPSCSRSISLCWSTIRQLFINGNASYDVASNFLLSVLYGLQMHGQHDGVLSNLLTLGVQIYELLRPTLPDLSNVLLQVSSCKASELKSFDDKIVQSQKQNFNDKKKRDTFKKFMADIIGKSVGEKFKRELHYQDLPPIFRIKPPKEEFLDRKDGNSGLCDLFKPANGNDI